MSSSPLFELLSGTGFIVQLSAPVSSDDITQHFNITLRSAQSTDGGVEQVLTLTERLRIDDDVDKKKTCERCRPLGVLWKAVTSHLGLLILLSVYSFLGALVFHIIEDRPTAIVDSNDVETSEIFDFNSSLASLKDEFVGQGAVSNLPHR